jgi:pimeloyl-ACP methyl ester carboxylesterase
MRGSSGILNLGAAVRGCLLYLMCQSLCAAPIADGPSRQIAELTGISIEVYTYRPASCSPKAFLLVLHGTNRNAQDYLRYATPLAETLCVIAVAPHFDKARFATTQYQLGGIVASDPSQSTGRLVTQLVAWLRAQVHHAEWPYALIGHSAGGQFLGRYAASTANEARAIVLANSGSYMFPSLEQPVPYGFGGLADADAALQRYLAEPLVLLLGDEDVHADKNLPKTPQDLQEGLNRRARGLNFFEAGKALAAQRHWEFRWRRLEVPGVAHQGAKMLGSPQALEALQGLAHP